MKKYAKKFIILDIVALLLAVMLTFTFVGCQSGNRKKVEINDVDDVLINPGKGWVDYGDAVWFEEYRDIVNLGYARFDWSYIEPEKGQYNWEPIDRYIRDYAAYGKKAAFGVMCADTSATVSYSTPKWVFDEGAKYVTTIGETWDTHEKLEIYIPDWHDEIFLKNMQNFVKALGARYNGNENIAFIDIRNYGNWGEQHIFGIIGGDPNYEYETKNRVTPDELRDLYMMPYMQAFPDTLLVNPWGEKIYNDIYKWAIENGVSIRRDGLFVYSDGSECAMAEGKLPTIYEYNHDYRTLVNLGLWNTDRFLEYVNIGKPSYLRFYKDMYDENKEFCDYLANYMGYYFKIKQAEFDKTVKMGSETTIALKFKNDGVAPLFEDAYAYVALLDENDKVVKKFKTDIDAGTWTPDEETTEEIKISLTGVKEGEYRLAFGLFLNETDEKPTYLFGSEGKTEDRWYVFGETKIVK